MFPLSLFDDNPKILKDNDSFIMEVKLENYSRISNIGYITNKCYKNMKDVGSYIIIINCNINGINGPNAIYAISKSNMMQDGCINILSNSPDINGNTLELEWNKGEYPLLKYKASSLSLDSDNKLLFIIKVITSF
jgi:hypothetical protein